MAFAEMTKEELLALEVLAQARLTLARAELMFGKAATSLHFVTLTKDKMACDPWFAAQGQAVKIAFRGALSQTEAKARLMDAEAAFMRDVAPAQIIEALNRAGISDSGGVDG